MPYPYIKHRCVAFSRGDATVSQKKDSDKSFSMRFLSFGIVTCSQKSWALAQTALKVHVAELVKTIEGQELARVSL